MLGRKGRTSWQELTRRRQEEILGEGRVVHELVMIGTIMLRHKLRTMDMAWRVVTRGKLLHLWVWTKLRTGGIAVMLCLILGRILVPLEVHWCFPYVRMFNWFTGNSYMLLLTDKVAHVGSRLSLR
jgi:hypothetical protein